MEFGARCRQLLVDHDRRGRRIVEQDHDLREQAVSGAQIDDASAAEEPPHPPRHFPCLKQFLARQTSGVADRARDAMKQRVVWKTIEVPIGETPAGGRLEHAAT